MERDLQEFFLVNTPARIPGSKLVLDFSQYFRIIDDGTGNRSFAVTTHSYTYEILDAETAKELFAFHWEPHSKVQYPHMHIGLPKQNHMLPVDNKAHIPTGRVAVEDVVEFLISDLGIDALKPAWKEILKEERAKFLDIKRW